jgi:hypothetical protein
MGSIQTLFAARTTFSAISNDPNEASAQPEIDKKFANFVKK